MPEPLTRQQQLQAKENWIKHHEEAQHALAGKGWWAWVLSPVLAIFRPLSALSPVLQHDENPLRAPRKNWSLFLAALSLGTLYVIGVRVSLLLFASHLTTCAF